MYSSNRYAGVSPIIISLIRKKAQKLIKHEKFSSDDLEDIEQELMLSVIDKLNKVNVKYSQYSLANAAIESKAKDLIKYRLSYKRNYPSILEFDEDENQSGVNDIADTAYAEEIVNLERNIDLTKFISNLPAELLDSFNSLQEMWVGDLAKAQNVPRKKIYKDLQKLKDIFQNL